MKIRASVFTVLLSLGILNSSVLANLPDARYNSGCQLLLNDTRIYCYSGGYAKIVNSEITPLSDHYYLDLSRDFTVSDSYSNWVSVTNPPNFVTEPTTAYVSVKLSDSRVLINGGTGINDGKTLMKNQTVIYDAENNQWETVSNVSSIPQSYYGSGALAADNSVVFWGGVATIGLMIPTFNGTAKLSISQQAYKWNLQSTAIAPGNPRYGHTATADPTGKLIYYLGGRDIIRDPITGVYTRPYTTFTNILIYHTDTSVWEAKKVSSSAPPSGRMSHTATLVPSTGEIVIYGGAGPDSVGNRIPASDYIYIYNPAKNLIQPVTTISNDIGAGPRFGHSAVLRDKMLFVLFGIGNSLLANNDFHILNIETYTWHSTYTVDNTSSTNSTSGNSNSNGNSNGNGNGNNGSSSNGQQNGSSQNTTTKSGLSSGAIAGIIVGIVVAIALILAFVLIRRQRQKKTNQDNYPDYWDVTSINNRHSIPITSTGPIDINKIQGYTTTSRTNIVNDKDVNPPSTPPKAFLIQDSTLLATDQSTVDGSSGTYVSSGRDKPMLPDVYQPSIISPSSPNDTVKPDIVK